MDHVLSETDRKEIERTCGLARAVARAGHACGGPWSEAWVSASTLIRKHGVVPELHDALRAMQPAMRAHSSDKTARIAIDRALFFETHLPIDLDLCAGGVIKRDLREMPARDAERWRRLIALGMSTTSGAPKPTWVRRMGPLVDRIGAPRVAERVADWLRELSERPVLSLTPAGADAVRTLVWLTAHVGEPDLEVYVRALAGRAWRRGREWSPRHDRLIGGLAYALGESRTSASEARLLVAELEPQFRRTTARFAIAIATSKLMPRAAVISRQPRISRPEWTRLIADDARLVGGPTVERVNAFTGERTTHPSRTGPRVGIQRENVTVAGLEPSATFDQDGALHVFAADEELAHVQPIIEDLARAMGAVVAWVQV